MTRTAAALLLSLGVLSSYQTPTADCTTDTECMELCPVDDDQCDGGPQVEETDEQAQARLCREDADHCDDDEVELIRV